MAQLISNQGVMKHFLKGLAGIVSLAFGGFLFANGAQAIVVSPVIMDHDLSPGMTVSGKIMVTNESDGQQTYYTSFSTFIAEGEEGHQQFLQAEDDQVGIPSWFELSETAIVVQPKNSKELEYKITVPPNAEPGGHYAALFLSTSPETSEKTSSVGLSSKTGILFLIRVEGDITESASLKSFTVERPMFDHLPAVMSLRLENTGNVHIRPQGVLTVRNMWGGIVARVPANPKNSAVLPHSIRRLDTWWLKSEEIAEGGGFFAGLQNEWKNFALGRYEASVDVKYGSRSTPLEAGSVTFWVIPWRILVLAGGMIAVLFIVMKLYNQMIVSAALKKPKK